jgi:hypothetical protein
MLASYSWTRAANWYVSRSRWGGTMVSQESQRKLEGHKGALFEKVRGVNIRFLWTAMESIDNKNSLRDCRHSPRFFSGFLKREGESFRRSPNGSI